MGGGGGCGEGTYVKISELHGCISLGREVPWEGAGFSLGKGPKDGQPRVTGFVGKEPRGLKKFFQTVLPIVAIHIRNNSFSTDI